MGGLSRPEIGTIGAAKPGRRLLLTGVTNLANARPEAGGEVGKMLACKESSSSPKLAVGKLGGAEVSGII